MNEQKSDSVSQDPVSAPPESPKIPETPIKEHTGVLASITKIWHKKHAANPTEAVNQQGSISQTPMKSSPVSANSPAHEAVRETHMNISETIAHIFHKKSPQNSPKPESVTVSEVSEAPTVENKVATSALAQETSEVIDEKFARLLKYDTTYHSMVRSEDIKNIQLQLSMRYMILMLAIFVVIAWVVNNRVIMFGFSDFPVLARTRDALFVCLTGLFSLTVWFGSFVWFHNKIASLMLRILGVILFLVVLGSIYFPFLA